MEHKAGMAAEPGPRLWVLVRTIIVEDHVNDFADGKLGLDGIQEPDELLMPVALHAAPDHLAVEHVESSKQRSGAVSLIIMGHRSAPPRLQRQARLGAVERLDLAFFVDAEHHRVRRRVDIQPDDVTQLGNELRVARQFELPHRCGWRPCERQMRCTEETLIRTSAAIAAAVQCVVSPGGSLWVSATMRSPMAGGSGGTREGRVRSCNRPSTPACMNRSCHRHRQVLLLAVCRMISLVPRPSAVNSTIRARHTCF